MVPKIRMYFSKPRITRIITNFASPVWVKLYLRYSALDGYRDSAVNLFNLRILGVIGTEPVPQSRKDLGGQINKRRLKLMQIEL